MSALAEFERAEGHDDRALDVVEAGLSEIAATGEHLNEPILLLQRARLPASGDRASAIAVVEQAVGIARTMGARLFELRAATELARLHLEMGDAPMARKVLEPVVSWFSEGLDTTFLLEAGAVLGRL